MLDEILAEPDEAGAETDAPRTIDRQKLREEIDILQRLADWARSIGTDTKTKTLLTALDIGFEQMATTGAARKALIFTESRRTQDYLKTFLEVARLQRPGRALQRHQRRAGSHRDLRALGREEPRHRPCLGFARRGRAHRAHRALSR